MVAINTINCIFVIRKFASAYTINTDNENLISQTIQLYKIIHHITAIYNQKNPADCLGAVKKRASAAQKKAPKGFS